MFESCARSELHPRSGLKMLTRALRSRSRRPRIRPCGVEWLRFCGQVFKSIFVPRIRILSRRDYRTQPGVLTPGTDKKGARPEGGGRKVFPSPGCRTRSQRISAAPLGRGPISMCPGLKPQAQSYSPIGTKKSIRSKYRR